MKFFAGDWVEIAGFREGGPNSHLNGVTGTVRSASKQWEDVYSIKAEDNNTKFQVKWTKLRLKARPVTARYL